MWLQALRSRAASRTLIGLTTSAECRDGLLHGLDTVLRCDGALRAQLAAVLAKHLQHNPESPTPRRYAPLHTLTWGFRLTCREANTHRVAKGKFRGGYTRQMRAC